MLTSHSRPHGTRSPPPIHSVHNSSRQPRFADFVCMTRLRQPRSKIPTTRLRHSLLPSKISNNRPADRIPPSTTRLRQSDPDNSYLLSERASERTSDRSYITRSQWAWGGTNFRLRLRHSDRPSIHFQDSVFMLRDFCQHKTNPCSLSIRAWQSFDEPDTQETVLACFFSPLESLLGGGGPVSNSFPFHTLDSYIQLLTFDLGSR